MNSSNHILKRLVYTWKKPAGFDTNIKIYNCVAKTKVPFIARNKDYLTWYTCGPTVYDSAHIGHASCFVKLDIIQRILCNYFNFNLVTVMNITDIDDKIINRSLELKQDPFEIAKRYEKEFLNDLTALGVTLPNIVIKVTDKIDLIIKFIEKLLTNGYAYRSNDGSVYFDTTKLDHYGKLQNIVKHSDQDNVNLKKSNMDFALWKSAKQNEPFWETSWGPGRPGWHIECSALAGHVLGHEIDVHAGGIDLQFPHHENEEAQSCAFFSKQQWVNYWIHTGHLHLQNSEKMSKSLKNTISISDLLKSYKSEEFRMACLMSHYSKQMEFSPDLMKSAKNLLDYYKNFLSLCSSFASGILQTDINTDILQTNLAKTSEDVKNALLNDFDTASVLKYLHNFTSLINKMLNSSSSCNNAFSSKSELIASANYVLKIFNSLGLNLKSHSTQTVNQESHFENVLETLIKFRENVRDISLTKKDFEYLKLCDNVRTDLAQCGIVIKDHGKKTTLIRE